MNVIRQALANLPGKWFQGDIRNPYNRDEKCGLGHLSDICVPHPLHNKDGEALFNQAAILISKVAGEQFPERKGSRYTDSELHGNSSAFCFADFNDHPDTTEDDVIMVFEKAAILLDEQV